MHDISLKILKIFWSKKKLIWSKKMFLLWYVNIIYVIGSEQAEYRWI